MNNTNEDIDLIRLSGSKIISFFNEKKLESLKCYEVFKGIFDLTEAKIGKGNDNSEYKFNAEQICIASQNPQKDYESSKKFIKTHCKNFKTQLEKHKEELTFFLNENKCSHIPFIDSTHSDGGHKNYFFIKLKLVDNESVSANTDKSLLAETESPLLSNAIKYKTKQLPKPLPWTKPLLKIKIDGWKSLIFSGIPILGIVFGVIILLWNLFYLSEISLITAIISSLFYFGFYEFLWPFYDAMFKRVGMAPRWMLNMDVYEAQLRAKKSDETWENGKHKRILEVVIFEAECSICGSVVSVTRGKGLYKGRLIGICDESPREHVFSFDHVTKKGVLFK